MSFADGGGGTGAPESGGGGIGQTFKNLFATVARGVGRAAKDVGTAFSAPVHDLALLASEGLQLGRTPSARHAAQQDFMENSVFVGPLVEEGRGLANTLRTGRVPSGEPLLDPDFFSLHPWSESAGRVSKVPGARMVPGVNTLFNSMSPEGRTQLGEHPGMAALDVASVVVPLKAKLKGPPLPTVLPELTEGSNAAIKARAALAPLRAKVSPSAAKLGAEIPAAAREASELVRSRTADVAEALSKLSREQYEELSFRLPRGIEPPVDHPLFNAYRAYADYQDLARQRKLGRVPPQEWYQMLREKTLESPSRKTGMVLRDRLRSGLTASGLAPEAAAGVVEDMSRAFLAGGENPHPAFGKAWEAVQREYRRNVRSSVQSGRLHEEPLTGEVYALEDLKKIRREGGKLVENKGPREIRVGEVVVQKPRVLAPGAFEVDALGGPLKARDYPAVSPARVTVLKDKAGPNFHISFSKVSSDVRGMGVGKAMYRQAGEEALRQGGHLVSSDLLSDDAARVWMSLEKDGLARSIGDRRWMYEGQAKVTLSRYMEALRANPPGRFATLLEEFQRAAAEQRNRILVEPGFGSAAARQAVEEVGASMASNWLDIAQRDSPVFVHRKALAGPFEEARGPVRGAQVARPSSLKSSQGLAPTYTSDAGWAMLADEAEDAMQVTMQKAVADVYRRSGGKSYGRLNEELLSRGFDARKADSLIKKSRRSLDVQGGRIVVGEAKPGTLTIPRELADIIDYHVNPKVYSGMADKVLNYWMIPTLWLAPVFHLNNMVGGAIATAFRMEPNASIFSDIAEAVSAARKGRIIDPRIPGGQTFAPHFRKYMSATAESVAAERYGRGIAAFAKDRLPNPIKASEKMNEIFDRSYRNFIYLNKRSGGASRELALREAAHLMQDYDSMLPIERQIAQRIFPFWGWRRTLIKHALTYPGDHPFRMAVLNSAARQLTEDESFKDDIEGYMLHYVPVTDPDAQGFTTYLSLRGLNPFADYSNMATVGGWLSSMHPLYRTLMEGSKFARDEHGEAYRTLDPKIVLRTIPQLRLIQQKMKLPDPDEPTPDGWMRWLQRYGPSLRISPSLKTAAPEKAEATASGGGFATP